MYRLLPEPTGSLDGEKDRIYVFAIHGSFQTARFEHSGPGRCVFQVANIRSKQ